ncbi:hypothetical protein ACQJBY_005486 [Aegilops geniculata]
MECKAAREPSSSPLSSSMDSCGAGGPRATVSTASSCYRPAVDRVLSTDLHLGLSLRSCSSSIHTADGVSASTPRSLQARDFISEIELLVHHLHWSVSGSSLHINRCIDQPVS